MTEKNNYKVSDIMRLDQLQKEVEAIFEEIEGKYRLSKEEFLILLTLWDQGSMTLKEMDDYVKVKTYKRTRTYNNLVEMKWIVKERPSVRQTMKEPLLFILMRIKKRTSKT